MPSPAINLILRSSLDADARAHAAATGASDVAGLSAFAKGLKAEGHWNDFVFWLMRSSQNFGSGTTVRSFGGLETSNGTLVNGPTWGANGIATGASSYVTATYARTVTATPLTMLAVYSGLTVGNNQAITAISSTASGTPVVWVDTMSAGTANLRGFQRNDASASTFNDTSNYLSVNGGNLGATNTVLPTSAGMVVRSHAWAGTEGAHTLNNITCGGALRTTFGSPAAATYALFGYGIRALTNAQIASLYSLIKNTIGQGLSLP